MFKVRYFQHNFYRCAKSSSQLCTLPLCMLVKEWVIVKQGCLTHVTLWALTAHFDIKWAGLHSVSVNQTCNP